LEKGVLIIHACAFDSVPADFGVLYAMRQFPTNLCQSIESFLMLICPEGLGGHFTTYECAVHGIGDAEALKSIRRQIDAKYPKPSQLGPKTARKGSYFFDERLNKYAIPFMGADASVVRSSQRGASMLFQDDVQQWPQYAAYVTIENAYYLTLTALYGTIFSSLASYQWGRNLLLSAPGVMSAGVFSHDGPTEIQLANTSFEMHFYGVGYSTAKSDDAEGTDQLPDKLVHIKVSGPEPGYVATPIIFVTLALDLLAETDRDLMPKGGVFTPGAAFFKKLDGLINKLNSAGINFDIIDDMSQNRNKSKL